MIIKQATLMYCIGGILTRAISSGGSFIYHLQNITSGSYEQSEVEGHQRFGATKDARILNNIHNFEVDKKLGDSKIHTENVGEGRLMASYFFPMFPQFYDVDYNDVWNGIKRSDTIGYFLFENTLDVSVVN